MDDRERRYGVAPELRVMESLPVSDGDDGRPTRIVGYAAVFNQLSDVLGWFREQIAPGAFAEAIGGDVRALWNHNPDYVLGRTVNGTLRLHEDDHGLAFEVEAPETQWARDALETIRRGDVNQMSFSFETVRDRWEGGTETETRTRTLLQVRLHDVSPVTFPAYPQTSAQVRARMEGFTGPSIQEDEGPCADDGKRQGLIDHLRRRVDLAEI